jgi:hypothetical protein
MPHMTRALRPAAGSWLLGLMACALIVGGSSAGHADSGMADVRLLPRLDGAQEDVSRTRSNRLTYSVPIPVANAVVAAKKLLSDDGWVLFARPMEGTGPTTFLMKKGPLGLYVSFSFAHGKPDQARVDYDADRINADLPFPHGATDIIFDGNRPYLGCIATGSVDATLDFFGKTLAESGWSPLTAASVEARWPNAKIDSKLENGARAYYGRDSQLPIMLSLRHRDDGRTSVEIKVASFALPQELAAGGEIGGLPTPEHTKSSTGLGSSDSNRREMNAAVIADIPAVLAFYRRELTGRGWKEESKGAVLNPDDVKLAFSSADGNAALELGRKYDFTTVSLVVQASPAFVAAKAKAQKDATDKFMNDANERARVAIAESEATRAAASAAAMNTPAETLRPLQGSSAPVPLPETADAVQYDGAEGRLEFNSSSSVKSVAAFYRAAMKPLGWNEQPSVINNPTLVVLEFSKGQQRISFTAIQLGPKVNVRATGSGLKTSAVAAAAPSAASGAAPVLEAEDDSGLPVPKQHTMSSVGASKARGSQIAVRRELNASVPADLNAVLGFYRSQLTKRQWKELPGAVVKPDQAVLAFSSPDGPALLKLDRHDGETTVNLAVKNQAEAAKSGMAPSHGQAKLMFTNMGDADAAITINAKTIRIAAGAGGPNTAGPTLELPPGKYRYALKIAGKPDQNQELLVAADDAWGLLIAPGGDGVLPMQVY